MSEHIVRRILTFLAVALVFATIVFAQSPTTAEIPNYTPNLASN